ncbi:MAG: ATP-binding cassette domain-containing protein, partial [Streptomycetaceae bacterium]|nr:ATP-binding cassette domain-containing protein [Streptomycetaceae bacterium]
MNTPGNPPGRTNTTPLLAGTQGRPAAGDPAVATPRHADTAQVPRQASSEPVAPATEVIRLHDASKQYRGGLTALDRASLTIREGELLAIVGPSGSGKSTLLNLMGTLDRPSAGRVEVLGHDVARLSDRRLSAVRARWIGFVFQQFF